MSKNTMTKLRQGFFLFLFLFIFLPLMAGAETWTDPSCAPPNCNVDGPVWISPGSSQEGFIDLTGDAVGSATLKLDPEATTSSFNDLSIPSNSSSTSSGLSITDDRASITDQASLEVISSLDDLPAIYGYSTGTGTAYGAFFDSDNNAGVEIGGGIKFVGLSDFNEPTYVDAGLLYYNTDSSLFKFYNGTTWVDLGIQWSANGDELYHSLSAGNAKGVAIKTGDTSDPNDAYTLDIMRKSQSTSDRAVNAYFEDVSTASYVSGSLGAYDGSGNMIGVRGKADISNGIGVYGDAGLSGEYGGYFASASNWGTGIFVEATGNSGASVSNIAGQFEVAGDQGKAVVGLATNASVAGKMNFGGYFEAAGELGMGVYGRATSTDSGGGVRYGGYFLTSGYTGGTGVYGSGYYGGQFVSASGRAVYARATTTGAVTNYGGYFTAAGDTARAVYGEATSLTAGAYSFGGYFSAAGDLGYGVYGLASGANGRGVQGYATSSAAGNSIGVYGMANSLSGVGVSGNASATGAVTNYGGSFSAAGDSGRAVYGTATATGLGVVNYGGYFTAAGDAGYGVYGTVSGKSARAISGTATSIEAGSTSVGVYGASHGEDGAGVKGYSYSDSVTGAGGYFMAAGDSGVGIYAAGPAVATATALALKLDNGAMAMEELATLPTNTVDSNYGKFYIDSSDNLPYFLDDQNVTHSLTAGGSGTIADGSAEGQLTYWDNTGSTWAYTDTSDIIWDDTNGRLGIGNSSPDQLLDISKDQNSTTSLAISNPNGGTSARAGFALLNGGGGGDGAYFNLTGNGYTDVSAWQDTFVLQTGSLVSGGMLHYAGVGPIQLSTSGSNAPDLYVDDSGVVGINTSAVSASNRLTVYETSTVANATAVYGYATKTGAYANYGGRFIAAGDSGVGVYAAGPTTPTTTALALKLDNGGIAMEELSTVPAHATGYGMLYVKSGINEKIYFKDEGGTEYDLTGGGSPWTVDTNELSYTLAAGTARGVAVKSGDLTGPNDNYTFDVYRKSQGTSDRALYSRLELVGSTDYASGTLGGYESIFPIGVIGKADASLGRGVYGDAGTNGSYGGYFTADGGIGVRAEATRTGAVLTTGLQASAVSDLGRAVWGSASSTSVSTNYGGYFTAAGVSGRGVYAEASGSSGRGIEGNATATGVVTTYGGYFSAAGDIGRGVYGYATATGNVGNTGVEGVSLGDGGNGVYGRATATGAVTNRGVYGYAYGDSGRGVEGVGPTTGAVTNYGGMFRSYGDSGVGVYGYGWASGVGITNIGGWFQAAGDSGVGVYAAGPTTPTATALALKLDNGAMAMEELATLPTNTLNSNYGKFYVDSSDNLPYFLDDQNVTHSLTGGGDGSSLWDIDADTGIQVEEGADDDIIRFDAGGVEDRFYITSDAIVIGEFGAGSTGYIVVDNSVGGNVVVASTEELRLGDSENLGNGTDLIIDDTNSKIYTYDNVGIGTATLTSTNKLTVENSISSAGIDATAFYGVASNSAVGGNVYGANVTATGQGGVVGGSFTATAGAIATGVYGSGRDYGGNFIATTGYGVQAISSANSGRGISASASVTGAYTNYGGYFTAAGDTAYGVYADATGTGVGFDTKGVYGQSYYIGVQGVGRSIDGTNENYGGYFTASTVNSTEAGVYAKGTTGKGIYAEATGTGELTNYGGYFEAAGDSGRAVYGIASASSATYLHYGGFFTAPSGDGIGLYATGNQAAAHFGGDVGINTSTPDYDLDIVGDMLVDDGSGSYGVYIGNVASAPTGQSLYLLESGSAGLIKNYLDNGTLTLQAGTSSSYANKIVLSGGTGTDDIKFYNGTVNVASINNTGDIYVGVGSGTDDDYIYFDANVEWLRYDEAVNNRFELSGSLAIGDDSGTDNDYLYFDQGVEYLVYDEVTDNRFEFSDDVYASGIIRSNISLYSDDNIYLNYDQTSSVVNILFGTTGSTAAEYIQYHPTYDTFIFSGAIDAYGSYIKAVSATRRDLYIGNDGIMGYISSSRRYKENIKDMENTDWLHDLRPVNFTYKNDDSGYMEYGLIAEEVEEVNKAFVSYNEEGQVETVAYSALITPMLAAIQEQQVQIEELQEKRGMSSDSNNDEIMDYIKSLESRIEDLESKLD